MWRPRARCCVFFWREWVLIVKGLGTSIGKRKAETIYERMAWLLIIATIPAGIFGLLLTHELQDLFARSRSRPRSS